MENLNDVEFGVDENQEEAPILIAQRQLNIFRQVHIFNKAKRDQFDDELLALPEVVINYIKKMPGGRLLIEHLEDVKTKRGISFVKSTSEDFASPDDTTPAPQQSGAGVPAQYVGGSLTMDANFADTFAKSMAEAFKQLPSPTINATGTPALSGDFGQFFEMIAVEIRTSRSSLLDVLKETKNITDSVIASQVSISRILEGILSSQTKGDTDTATMNNRIIASQASITKLLENLYTSNTQKNDEVSTYLNVDNKLQDFRNQLEQSINNSLASIVNHIYDTTNKQAADMAVLDIEKRLATFKSELEADILKSLAQLQVAHPTVNSKTSTSSVLPHTQNFEETDDIQIDNDFTAFTDESEEHKKKKKKKKKKNQDIISDTAFNTIVAATSAEASQADADYRYSPVDEPNSKVEGVIRNSDYPHEDNFDNIDLDLPPLEGGDLDDISASSEDSSANDDEIWVEGNGKGYPLSENSVNEDNNSLDDLMDDGIDFALPEQGAENASLEQVEEDNNIQPTQDLSSLDDLMSEETDFALPEQNAEAETPNQEGDSVQSKQDLSSLDDLMNEGTDFALPEQNAEAETPNQEGDSVQSTQDLSSLDDLLNEGTDFALPEPNNVEEGGIAQLEENNVQPTQDFGSLDDLMNDTPASNSDELIDNDTEASLDDLTPSDAPVPDNTVEEADDLSSDDITTDEGSEHSSRYSAELDKIRAALTSDNIDISSLDKPIALDDYDDDANVSEDDDVAYSSNVSSSHTEVPDTVQPEQEVQPSTSENGTEEEWEWEYVDENGNPIPQDENNANDEDWEWEYVEDDSSTTEDNNKPE